MIPFRCLHSGRCCEDTSIQINLTAGDIIRLSEYMHSSPLSLFRNRIIGFVPFFDGESGYDIEVGIIKPCKLRKNSRCSVYPARPLNCRIFPYYIFGIKDYKSIELECIRRVVMNESLKQIYKRYTEALGKVIMKESRITERIYREIGRVHIPKNKIDSVIINLKKPEYEFVKRLKGDFMTSKQLNKIESILSEDF